jgi:hypothetical protein
VAYRSDSKKIERRTRKINFAQLTVSIVEKYRVFFSCPFSFSKKRLLKRYHISTDNKNRLLQSNDIIIIVFVLRCLAIYFPSEKKSVSITREREREREYKEKKLPSPLLLPKPKKPAAVLIWINLDKTSRFLSTRYYVPNQHSITTRAVATKSAQVGYLLNVPVLISDELAAPCRGARQLVRGHGRAKKLGKLVPRPPRTSRRLRT